MDKQTLALMIAGQLHEDWRKTRLNEDGTFEPRWKKVKNEEFLKGLNLSNLPEHFRLNESNEV